MGEVSTIGLDIGKSVFQVHGADSAGAVGDAQAHRSREGVGVLWRPVAVPGRDRSLSVGTSLEPRAASVIGHTVRLMPPSYVKAYLKRSKNDANDAAAILRGGDAAIDAVCADQDKGSTDWADVAPDPAIAGASAHNAVERDPRAYG